MLELKSFLSAKIFTSLQAVIDFIYREKEKNLKCSITKAYANFRCFAKFSLKGKLLCGTLSMIKGLKITVGNFGTTFVRVLKVFVLKRAVM
jgi:hypothetical protein